VILLVVLFPSASASPPASVSVGGTYANFCHEVSNRTAGPNFVVKDACRLFVFGGMDGICLSATSTELETFNASGQFIRSSSSCVFNGTVAGSSPGTLELSYQFSFLGAKATATIDGQATLIGVSGGLTGLHGTLALSVGNGSYTGSVHYS
jgi:hypothetical protein